MYIANRFFKNTQNCVPDKCKQPKKEPCKPQPCPKQPFCVFEIKCTPFDDCPPEVRFEFKI